VARADDNPDAVRATALFAEGRRLMATEDYASACPKLAESQALEPAADTALDLAICYQKASQAAFKVAHDLARPSEDGSRARAASSRSMEPDTDGQRAGQNQRTAGLSIGAAGATGIVAGLITGLMSKSDYDSVRASCPSDVCPSAGTFAQSRSQYDSAMALATASTVSLLTGAVAMGAGAIVFFTAPKSKPSAVVSVGLGPTGPGAGLSVAGRF
jgi:hypothetical protein